MKNKLLLLLLILTAAVIINLKMTRSSTIEPYSNASERAADVLVELFTSEGCSSCPPADEALARLEETQPVAGARIIILSLHVDYWNHLGWSDPYSSAEFSERQSRYASAFASDDIYTPQMVVDGHIEFVGSNMSRAREAIAEARKLPKATVTLSLARAGAPSQSEARLNIRVENLPKVAPDDTADVLVAVAENGLRSEVARGENAGRRLSHSAVVRKLSLIGSIDPNNPDTLNQETIVRIEKGWKRENLKAVAIVQERRSRRVVGAAALSLASRE